MPQAPGIPGSRLPLPSSSDDGFEAAARAARQAEQVAIAVEQKLGERLGKLEGSLLGVDVRLADLEKLVTTAKAFAASTTVKVMLAMLGSGGLSGLIVRLASSPPPPAQTVIQRSAFDRKLDVCRDLRDGAERGACVGRVAAEDVAAVGIR